MPRLHYWYEHKGDILRSRRLPQTARNVAWQRLGYYEFLNGQFGGGKCREYVFAGDYCLVRSNDSDGTWNWGR